jgi:protein arginine N-methyltransferase 1
MYDLLGYGAMLADTGRTAAYARAIEQRIGPGAVVLDIGTGAGIMALLACRAGATRVYAVESAHVIHLARTVAAANGLADRIVFIHGMSTAITLPERVDGIVADVHGVLPLYQQSVVSLVDARTRFLKPGGWIVPGLETMWATLVSSRAAHEQVALWNNLHGFNYSAARQQAANTWREHRFRATDLITAPQRWATLDYARVTAPGVSGAASWTIDRDAVAHGIAVWFDAEIAPGVALSNSPSAAEEHVYSQGFFPWPEALHLAPGDEVRVDLRADLVGEHYVWTWQTRITDRGSAHTRAAFRQSSMLADPLNPEQLRKRGHTFAAELNDDGRIDRHVLDLMERRLPLGDIATDLLERFPEAFKSWDEALGRTGVLANRYSR